MAASYVDRLRAIRDALEQTADNIDDREYVSDATQEKADAYREAVEAIDMAIDVLESIPS